MRSLLVSLLDVTALPKIAWRNRSLLWMTTRRNIEARYKGSVLGLVWSFAHPLMMMCVYTFVFGFVFHARWAGEIGSKPFAFPVIMLCGMAVFSIFSEGVSSSGMVIVGNPNYVKKVIFPLEILPLAQIASAFLLNLPWFVLLFIGAVALLGQLSFTMLLLPVVMIPLLILATGIAFFTASLTVYLRDTQYLVTVVLQILFFMSPIFYSLQALPPVAIKILSVSPLAYLIEAARAVFLYGVMPNWGQFLFVLVESIVVLQFGFVWFEKTKKGFADVL